MLTDKLIKTMEYISGTHGDQVKWLIEDTPKDEFLISEKSKKAITVIYNALVPDFRVYLPAKFSFRRGRILSLPSYDAVDHFLLK